MFKILLITLLGALQVQAQFFNFFNQQRQQQRQPQRQTYEEEFLDINCDGYICPDTFACVKEPKDCPCRFPNSQLKCVLPDSNYICISKPASKEEEVNKLLDEDQGPLVAMEGYRDCGWVYKAYQGLA